MDLSLVVKLQNIDYKIMDLESSIGDLPEQITNLKNKVDLVTNEISENNTKVTEYNSNKIKKEGEINSLNEKLKKYQEQVYNVTTNKEYDAISTEIENTEKAIELNETNILELLEAEDIIQTKLKEISETYDKDSIELKDKQNLLDNKTLQNKDKLITLTSERKTITEQLNYRIYATYERIRKGRNGVAVTEIKNYICRECFATIPAQTVVEVRKMDSIKLCETCGRILICANNNSE